MWSINSLPLLPGPLWPRVEVPLRVQSMGQKELSNHLLYSKPLNCVKMNELCWIELLVIKGFRTIVFIFIVISTTLQPICLPAFFRCLSNSGTYIELQTTSFIESTEVACSDSVSHNWVQVLSIPVLLLTCSQDWTCNHQMIFSLEA